MSFRQTTENLLASVEPVLPGIRSDEMVTVTVACSFNAKLKGALGYGQRFRGVEVSVRVHKDTTRDELADEIRLSLYDTYEHIYEISFREIERTEPNA